MCYMAPEILNNEEYNGTAVDIFAAGVILFTMISQRPPFGNAEKGDIFYKLFYLNQLDEFWQNHQNIDEEISYSAPLKELLGCMLAVNPSERPSIADIKGSEWYNGDLPTAEELEEEFKIRQEDLNEYFETKAAKEKNSKCYDSHLVFRSLVDEDDEDDEDDEERKIDFSKIEIGKYSPDFHRCTKFFVKDSPDNIFRKLLDFQNDFKTKCDISADEHIIIHLKEPESVIILVNILKIEEKDVHCVEFIKEFGDLFDFYDAYT